MQIVVLAEVASKEELLAHGIREHTTLKWIQQITDFENYPNADAWIDLLFEPVSSRIELLKKLTSGLVIINSVAKTLRQTDNSFVRINAWPTFLKRSVMEGSIAGKDRRGIAEKILSCFNRKVEWVPDEPGFITARIVSMIINEAYFTLEENISTKPEIDTAMKLGTNYPYGPFEWSQKIGLKNILDLLSNLEIINKRYAPSALLKKEVKK
jgi:3-hydroxybutyryl-CoA dehydrogenase